LVVGAEEAEACKGEGKLAVAAVVVSVVRPRWCLRGGTGLLVVVFGRCKRWWQWRGEREREREKMLEKKTGERTGFFVDFEHDFLILKDMKSNPIYNEWNKNILDLCNWTFNLLLNFQFYSISLLISINWVLIVRRLSQNSYWL
jgi:hypothetical protein